MPWRLCQRRRSAQVRGSVRNFTDVRAIRAKALYDNDAAKPIRKSHENPAIQQLYKEYFGEPGSIKLMKYCIQHM